MAGSSRPTLGVFSAYTYLDEPGASSGRDIPPEAVLVVEREPLIEANALIPPVIARPDVSGNAEVEVLIEQDSEIGVEAHESMWPIVQQILVGIFYLLFVIAVAVAVNKILTAL